MHSAFAELNTDCRRRADQGSVGEGQRRRAVLAVALIMSWWMALTLTGACFADADPPRLGRAVVVTGGHGFNRDAFFEMLASDDGFEIVEARHTDSTCDAYANAELDNCDVVVLYDMVQHATPEQRQAFLSLVNRGVGLVVLHHALVSHQEWEDYERIVGGKYPEGPSAGEAALAAGYQHDVDIPVHVCGNHPVTAGLADFTVHDEIYWGFPTAPDVTPLLTTSHPKSGNPLAWARLEGASRVVYIQIGHGPGIFADANYRQLIQQSMRWASRVDAARVLAGVRELERHRVTRLAKDALAAPPLSITDHRAEHSEGGPHDFYSNGDYWWPDPDSPGGLPFIQRDGESNPGNFVQHRQALNRMRDHVAALAAAYRLTGDDRYAEKSAQLLSVFFLDPATRMNPHLEYAQAIPGRTPGRGIGIIDALHLIEIPKAIEALRGSPAMSPEVVDGMREWFADFSRWMQTSRNGREEADTTNNHRVAYYLQLAVYADFVGDQSALAKCRQEFEEVFLAKQMAADGGFPRELGRTKPYGYSIFQLDNMAALCHVLSQPGDDLWRLELADGRGMGRAVEYLYPYLKDKSTWPLPPDVQAWDDWPARQPALLFAGIGMGEQRFLDLWRRQHPDPTNPEVRRNIAITQPLLWLDAAAQGRPAP